MKIRTVRIWRRRLTEVTGRLKVKSVLFWPAQKYRMAEGIGEHSSQWSQEKYSPMLKFEAQKQVFFCMHPGGHSFNNWFKIVIQFTHEFTQIRRLRQIHQVIVVFMHNDIHGLKMSLSEHSIWDSLTLAGTGILTIDTLTKSLYIVRISIQCL